MTGKREHLHAEDVWKNARDKAGRGDIREGGFEGRREWLGRVFTGDGKHKKQLLGNNG